MSYLKVISDRLYKQATKDYGEETARNMWAYAEDPVTGYVSRDLNCVNLLDGKIPCQRCGGFGIWKPPGSNRDDKVLCVRCHDWGDAAPKLLDKHGYVWSKKKWHGAFMEFCSQKPEWYTYK